MTKWSDYRTWKMDLFKSIIVFILVASASYFILDGMNQKREEAFFKWQVEQNINTQAIRDFELAYWSYLSHVEPGIYHKMFKKSNSYSKNIIDKYDKSKINILEKLSSLIYWSSRKNKNIDFLGKEFSNILNTIDKFAQKHTSLLKEEFNIENKNKYDQYWHENKLSQFDPLLEELELSFKSIIDTTLK